MRKTTKTVKAKVRTVKTVKPDRLAVARETIEANREALRRLKRLVHDITVELNLDEERMAKRVDSATRSEYGAINGMINLVAAIAAWPAEPGDGAMVASNKLVLENKFGLDLLMLDDIRTYRGYHSFVTDNLEIISGIEPNYENYSDYCQIFLADLGVDVHRPTITKEQWQRQEAVAVERAQKDLVTRQEALVKHREYLESLQK